LFQLLAFAIIFDIIFVQKVLLHPFYFRLLKFVNSNIVFDFDDAIYTVYRGNENLIGDLNELRKIENNEKRFACTVANSKLIVLENEVAKEKAQLFNNKILMITGPIDINRYKRSSPKVLSDRIVIGWIGSSYTTSYLDIVSSVIEKVITKYPNVFFKTIGASNNFRLSKNYIHTHWELNTEVRELQDFDIGIMPLPNDEYARCKGGYKILQYMSMGIPSIASSVGVNNSIIVNGINGFLVNNENQWYEMLVYLIENLASLNDIGSNARAIALDQFSYEINAPIWLGSILEIVRK
jgi:glycosyltransferase involved in cell wall biosynthesis